MAVLVLLICVFHHLLLVLLLLHSYCRFLSFPSFRITIIDFATSFDSISIHLKIQKVRPVCRIHNFIPICYLYNNFHWTQLNRYYFLFLNDIQMKTFCWTCLPLYSMYVIAFTLERFSFGLISECFKFFRYILQTNIIQSGCSLLTIESKLELESVFFVFFFGRCICNNPCFHM